MGSFLADRLDEGYRQHQSVVRPKLQRLPSEYLYSQVYASFQHDRSAVAASTAMGWKNVCWGSDYPHDPPQNRGLTAIDGAMALIVILLIVQIWLLSATLESYLAGHPEAALPGAMISGILFAACLGLYRFVDRIDSEIAGVTEAGQST